MIPVLMRWQLPFRNSLQDDRKDGRGEVWRTRKQAADAIV